MRMVSHDGDSSEGGAAVAKVVVFTGDCGGSWLTTDGVFLFFDTRLGHHDLNQAES